MKKLLFIALVTLTNRAIAEKLPVVTDFAMQNPLEVSQNTPLQALQLPEDVYKTVTNANLNDIRIFNASGSVVPFEVQNIGITTRSEQEITPLPFFPIKGAPAGETEGKTEVRVSKDEGGKIVSVEFGDGKQGTAVQNTYLIDLRNFRQRLETLRFQWESPEQLVGLSIDASSNLKDWRLVASGVLARLDYAGQNIQQNGIECCSGSSSYLRIAAPSNTEFKLVGVDALYSKTDIIEPAPLVKTVHTFSIPDTKTFLYDTGGVFPIHSVNFPFNEQNVLTRLSVSSRASNDGQWIPRIRTTAYSLLFNGTNATSGFTGLQSVVSDRYWKVETQDGESTLSAPPAFMFRWQPHRAIFMAQGSGPFTLAYGSAAFRSIPFKTDTVSSLARTLKVSPADAKIGAQQIAGGPSVLVLPPPQQVVEWKKWILWGVLGIALLVVLAMAKSLVRELKNS